MEELEPKAGDWIVYNNVLSCNRFAFNRAQVEKVTPAQIRVASSSWGHRIVKRISVRACLPTQESADLLIQSLDGASGEFEKRRRAAEDEKSRRVTEAMAATAKVVDRLIAEAMKAPA